MASVSSLPTLREVVTSLINSISNTKISPVHEEPSRTFQGSVFSRLPPSVRPRLTTLHVLFPTLLLPALDLLDRRLVTKVIMEPREPQEPVAQPLSQTSEPNETAISPEGVPEERKAHFYLVRSAASTSRKTFNIFANSTPYIVRLEAWSCSCANFAFEAYPAVTSDSEQEIMEAGPLETPVHSDGGGAWEFGGISLDGREPRGGGVPCCKHLLACVLADRWYDVLGQYVTEKRASKEEVAGLVADT